MSRFKQILVLLAGTSLLSLGLCLVFVAFLCLVVFRDGGLERGYTEQQRAANLRNGIGSAVGAVASLGSGAALVWWGLRRLNLRPDQENQKS